MLKRFCKSCTVAGVDEAGRGPLAGPVVAAAVVLPISPVEKKITDSKKLSPRERDYLSDEIKAVAKSWAVVAVGPRRIEELNIRAASLLAMKLACMRTSARFFAVDGNASIPGVLHQETVVRGDATFVEIAAASILAKVHRDRLMALLESRYPGYGLGSHMGYPTKAHRAAIAELHPTPAHRWTFRGVKEWRGGVCGDPSGRHSG